MWKYYVYELVDPRDNSVFYVGKGCSDRIDQHERDTAAGVSSKKCNKIRKIVGAGLTIGKRKVASFKDEQHAYDFEDERIAFYGKDALTNVAKLKGEAAAAATVNTFLSSDFMRVMAFGFKARNGVRYDYTGRPWATALYGVFMERFDSFVERALKEVGFEALRDGVRPFGVVLEDGR